MRVTGWRVAAAAAALMVAPTAVVHAQRIGVVAGATFSQLRGIENVKAKNRQGTMFGATLRLPLGNAIAVQPELLFVNKGSELELGTGETKNLRLDYFELPVLLRFEGGQGSAFGPHFYAGPSIGYNLDCKVSSSGVTNTSSDCKRDDFLKPAKVEWSGIVGAGVDLSVGGLGVTGGARYGVGLSNISKDDSDDFESRVRNGTLTVYVGVLFGKR